MGLRSLATPIALVSAAACGSAGDANHQSNADGRDMDGGSQFDATQQDAVGQFGSSSQEAGAASPAACAEAAMTHSYVGCDFWPTPVSNTVWSIFDFAVAVANGGQTAAAVTVTGPGAGQNVTVPPGGVTKIYLPWVPALKGPDMDQCTQPSALTSSVLARPGAYHLVSSSPVSVYQFNAIEYKPAGGPTGKDWSTCPGYGACSSGTPVGCLSYSNDASLLLPSTALTGNYRITGEHGWAVSYPVMGAYVAVTGTQNGTHVVMQVGPNGAVVAGPGVAPTAAGGTLELDLDAGDVAELLGQGQLLGQPDQASDLSGSLLKANKPVQVINGIGCIYLPDSAYACDHLEQTNLPVEALGTDYVVTMPTGPHGRAVPHIVRLYGNFEGTQLSFEPVPSVQGQTPLPSTIGAGQVFDMGVVNSDFEVKGTQPFAVASFQLGSSVVDPYAGTLAQGDPSQTIAIPTEQFRTDYVFLAPDDYEENFADVVAPPGAVVTLDGKGLAMQPSPVSSGFNVFRVSLSLGNEGAHVLKANVPVGLQVMGYGAATSYQYPGGSGLAAIAPVPVQ